MFRYCTWLLVAGLFFQVTGCSSGGGGAGAEKAKTVPLSGTLTLDGKPYGNVRVQFIPQGADGGVRTAYSEVKADGAFSATTYVTGDGIVAGKYDVRVGSDADTASTDPAAMMAVISRINHIQQEAFKQLLKEGVTGLTLLSMAEIGQDPDGTVDGTHPTDLGMLVYARAVDKKLRHILKLK